MAPDDSISQKAPNEFDDEPAISKLNSKNVSKVKDDDLKPPSKGDALKRPNPMDPIQGGINDILPTKPVNSVQDISAAGFDP